MAVLMGCDVMQTSELFCDACSKPASPALPLPSQLYALPSTLTNPAHPSGYKQSAKPVTNREQRDHTDPVQKAGHSSFRALPAPCGSQAERYGLRTARGIECGLNGFASQATSACATLASAERATPTKGRAKSMVVRDEEGGKGARSQSHSRDGLRVLNARALGTSGMKRRGIETTIMTAVTDAGQPRSEVVRGFSRVIQLRGPLGWPHEMEREAPLRVWEQARAGVGVGRPCNARAGKRSLRETVVS